MYLSVKLAFAQTAAAVVAVDEAVHDDSPKLIRFTEKRSPYGWKRDNYLNVNSSFPFLRKKQQQTLKAKAKQQISTTAMSCSEKSRYSHIIKKPFAVS